MKPLKNLGYRIKRFFQGESGIVEQVEPTPHEPDYILGDGRVLFNNYRDHNEDLSMQVTFRNPLEKLVKMIASSDIIESEDKRGGVLGHIVFRKYKPGDKFP